MNILNNLWLAVSTPNETLVKICISFLILFIEAPLTFSLISNTFYIKFTKAQKYLYILITGIFAVLATYCIHWPFNIILNYTSAFILLFFVIKSGFIKSIIAPVFPSIVFNVLGNLLLNPYLTLLDITYEQSMTIPIYRFIFAILMYLIVFSFTMVIKNKNISVKLLDNLDSKNKAIIIFNFIFGFFYIIMQCILTINYINILPVAFTFLNFICLLIYFCLSFYSLAKITKLVKTTQELESAEEYNKTLHILHDSVRGFKHDFDNIVTTIGGYIRTEDMKGLKKYYLQLEDDCQRVNNLYLLNPEIINNDGIYNLLTKKYNEAEEKDIKVNITFLLDLSTLHMKIYEFARILGILLDNAIEASSECEEKIINLTFRNDNKNSRELIIVENTYNDKNLDTEKIFEKGISGKDNHTGLGLWEVRKLIKKNNNINLYTSKNDNFFCQQLEIYY